VKFTEFVRKAPGKFDARVISEVQTALKRWLKLRNAPRSDGVMEWWGGGERQNLAEGDRSLFATYRPYCTDGINDG
jgi:hypothetical protein